MANSDLIFYAGGEVYESYGSLSKKTSREEDVAETFTRNSTAYYIDRAGVLRIAEIDALRTEWTGSAFDTPAVLLEDARTNSLTRSEELSDGAWSKVRCSVPAGIESAPDGTATGDKIIEDATAAQSHYITRSLGAATSSTDQVLSFFVKAGERDWVRIITFDKADNNLQTWFNARTGLFGTTGHTAGARVTGPFANGQWFRVEVVFDSDTGAFTPLVELHVSDANGSTSHDGDGSSGLFIWGVQFETDSPFSSSYIKTVGSTVTRAAETLSFPFPFKPQEMTVYAKFIESGTAALSGNPLLFQISSGGGADARLFCFGGSNKYQITHDNGPTQSNSAHGTNVSIDDLVEIRATLDTTGAVQIFQALNSGSEVSASAGGAAAFASTWSGSTVFFNSDGTLGGQGFARYRAIKIARGTKSLAEMRALGV